jgi:hypothetical protein
MLDLWLKQVRSKALFFWDNLLVQIYMYVYSVYTTSTFLYIFGATMHSLSEEIVLRSEN